MALTATSPWARGEKILKERERYERTKVSRVEWWRKEATGMAPKRIKLGERSVGWLESEVDQWIQDRAAERGK
jgi:prophage regulatory protein